MQNNLFYLCGPMGSGKTTLAKELQKINPKIMIPELFSRNVKFHTEPNYRRILKIAGRAIENFEYLKIAKENPDKIILGYRCVYDCLAYNQVYYERGWISKETYDLAQLLCQYAFPSENSEPKAVILNPGFEIVKKHLERRWQETNKKKWGEEDMGFVKLTCKVFEEFQGKKNVLCINQEINLENRIEILEANEWIKEKVRDEQKVSYKVFSLESVAVQSNL